MYIGRYIWNRRRSRKKLKSGDREYVLRPQDEWVVVSHPELRVVSDDLWEQVKSRQRQQAELIGARVRRGLSKHQARATGTYPKYLLSGLVQCGICGSRLVISGINQAYICASRANGGSHACGSMLRLPRAGLQKQLLKWIGTVLSGNDAGERLVRAWRVRNGGDPLEAELDSGSRDSQVKHLRDEISNRIDALAHGALRSSPSLAERLAQAELRLAAEERSAAIDQQAGATSAPQSAQFYRNFIETISKRFEENSRETRTILNELVGGGIRLVATKDRRELVVCCGLGSTTLPLPSTETQRRSAP
jgi:site-specific DNA recombinase